MTDVKLPAKVPAWIKDHIELYLRDGEAGHYWDASSAGGAGVFSTLLLTTVGRKSGDAIALPLIYRPTEDGGYCVIASKGGAPAHPAWYLNILQEPEVKIKVANDEYRANASIVQGDERTKLWQTMADYFAPYNDYQAATDREIPVVVLRPQF